MNLPPDILLYALIAAGLIFWLKSMLGAEDENEEGDDKPGKKPFFLDQEEGDGDRFSLTKGKGDPQNKVASLNINIGAKFNLPRHVRIENKTAEIALERMIDSYSDLDLAHFIDGAQGAYIMVVEAFADKDRETLKNLLSPDVFTAFDQAIAAQEKTGEYIKANVEAVRKIDLVGANMDNNIASITLRFVASERRAIYNKKDDLIAGSPTDLAEMLDIWTFTRDMDEGGPAWLISETRSEEALDEDQSIPNSTSSKKLSKKTAAKKTKRKSI